MALTLLTLRKDPGSFLVWLNTLPPMEFLIPLFWPELDFLEQFPLPQIYRRVLSPLCLSSDMKWALSMAFSRSWIYLSRSDFLTGVMKPLLDMTNHSDQPNAEIFEDYTEFQIRRLCTSELRRGEQVFISYKPGLRLSAWDKFLFYGFVTAARFDMELPEVVPGDCRLLSLSWDPEKGPTAFPLAALTEGNKRRVLQLLRAFVKAHSESDLPLTDAQVDLLNNFCSLNVCGLTAALTLFP